MKTRWLLFALCALLFSLLALSCSGDDDDDDGAADDDSDDDTLDDDSADDDVVIDDDATDDDIADDDTADDDTADDDTADDDTAPPLGYDVGDTMPDFSLTDSLGNTVSLSDFAGKVVLLDSSAMW